MAWVRLRLNNRPLDLVPVFIYPFQLNLYKMDMSELAGQTITGPVS